MRITDVGFGYGCFTDADFGTFCPAQAERVIFVVGGKVYSLPTAGFGGSPADPAGQRLLGPIDSTTSVPIGASNATGITLAVSNSSPTAGTATTASVRADTPLGTVDVTGVSVVSATPATANVGCAPIAAGATTTLSCTTRKAGAYTLTARYGTFSATATVTVQAGPIARIQIGPAKLANAVAVGKRVAYNSAGYDRYGNLARKSLDASYTIAPDGSCAASRCSASAAGAHTVTASYVLSTGKTATSVAVFTAKAADHIYVAPVVVKPYIAEHGTYKFAVTAYASGVSLGDVTSDATLTLDPSGTCDATGSCVVGTEGTTVARAAFAGLTDSVGFTVLRVPTTLTLQRDISGPLEADQSVTFTATGKDARGIWDVTGQTDFTSTDGARCVSSQCSAAQPGMYHVTAAWRGSKPVAQTTITVGSGTPPPDHIGVSYAPSSPVLQGEKVTVTVRTFDGAGTPQADVSKAATITADGFSCTANVCTATAAGHHTITANYKGLHDTVAIDVADHIALTPADATLSAGQIQSYVLTAYDAQNTALGTVRIGYVDSSTPARWVWLNLYDSTGTTLQTGADNCSDSHCTATTAAIYVVKATNGVMVAQAKLTVSAVAAPTSCTPGDHHNSDRSSDDPGGDGWLFGVAPMVELPCGEAAARDLISPTTLYFWSDRAKVAGDVSVSPAANVCSVADPAAPFCVFTANDDLKLTMTNGVTQVAAPVGATPVKVTNAAYCHDPQAGWLVCFSDQNRHLHAVRDVQIGLTADTPTALSLSSEFFATWLDKQKPPAELTSAPSPSATWWQLDPGHTYGWNNPADVADHVTVMTAGSGDCQASAVTPGAVACTFSDGNGKSSTVVGKPGGAPSVGNGQDWPNHTIDTAAYCLDPVQRWLLCLTDSADKQVWAVPLTARNLSGSTAALYGSSWIDPDNVPTQMARPDLVKLPSAYPAADALLAVSDDHIASPTSAVTAPKDPNTVKRDGTYLAYRVVTGTLAGELDILGLEAATFYADSGAVWHLPWATLAYATDSAGIKSGFALMAIQVANQIIAVPNGLRPDGTMVDAGGSAMHDYLYRQNVDATTPPDDGAPKGQPITPVAYDYLSPGGYRPDGFTLVQSFDAIPGTALQPLLADPASVIDDGVIYDLTKSLAVDPGLQAFGDCSQIAAATVAHAAYGFVPTTAAGAPYREVLILRMAAGTPAFRLCDLNNTVNDAIFAALVPMLSNEVDVRAPDRRLLTTDAVAFEGDSDTVAGLPSATQFVVAGDALATPDGTRVELAPSLTANGSGCDPSAVAFVGFGAPLCAVGASYGYYLAVGTDAAGTQFNVGSPNTTSTLLSSKEPVIALQFSDNSIRLLAVAGLQSLPPALGTALHSWLGSAHENATALSSLEDRGNQVTLSEYLAADAASRGAGLAGPRMDLSRAMTVSQFLGSGTSVPAPSGLGRTYLTPADAAEFFDPTAVQAQLVARSSDPMVIKDLSHTGGVLVEARYEQGLNARQAAGGPIGPRASISGGLWALDGRPPVPSAYPADSRSVEVADWIMTTSSIQDQPGARSGLGVDLNTIAMALQNEGVVGYDAISQIVEGAYELLGISNRQLEKAEGQPGGAAYVLAAYRLRLALDPSFAGASARNEPTKLTELHFDGQQLQCFEDPDAAQNRYLNDFGMWALYRLDPDQEFCDGRAPSYGFGPGNLIGAFKTYWAAAGLSAPARDADGTWSTTAAAAATTAADYRTALPDVSWSTIAYALVAAQRGFAGFEAWANKATGEVGNALKSIAAEADDYQKTLAGWVGGADAALADDLTTTIGDNAVREAFAALDINDVLSGPDGLDRLNQAWADAMYVVLAEVKATVRGTAIAHNLYWEGVLGNYDLDKIKIFAEVPKDFTVNKLLSAATKKYDDLGKRGFLGDLNKAGVLNGIVALLGVLLTASSGVKLDLSDPYNAIVVTQQLFVALSYPTWWIRLVAAIDGPLTVWDVRARVEAQQYKWGIARGGPVEAWRFLGMDTERRVGYAAQALVVQMEMIRRSQGRQMTLPEIRNFLLTKTTLRDVSQLDNLDPHFDEVIHQRRLRAVRTAVTFVSPEVSVDDRIVAGAKENIFYKPATDALTKLADLDTALERYFAFLLNLDVSDPQVVSHAKLMSEQLNRLDPTVKNGGQFTLARLQNLMVQVVQTDLTSADAAAEGRSVIDISAAIDQANDKAVLSDAQRLAKIMRALVAGEPLAASDFFLRLGFAAIIFLNIMDLAAGALTMAEAIILFVRGGLTAATGSAAVMMLFGGAAGVFAAVAEFLGFSIAANVGFIIALVLSALALLITYLTKSPSADNSELDTWAEPYRAAGLLRPNQALRHSDGTYTFPGLEHWHSGIEFDNSAQVQWPVLDASGGHVTDARMPGSPSDRVQVVAADGQSCLTLPLAPNTTIPAVGLHAAGAPLLSPCAGDGNTVKEQVFADAVNNAYGTHQFVLDAQVADRGVYGFEKPLIWPCPSFDAASATVTTVSCRTDATAGQWKVVAQDDGTVKIQTADGVWCLSQAQIWNDLHIQSCADVWMLQKWTLRHVDGVQLTQQASGLCATIPNAWTDATAELDPCARDAAGTAISMLYPTVLSADPDAHTIAGTAQSKFVTMVRLSDNVCLSAAPVGGTTVVAGTPVKGGECRDAFDTPAALHGWLVDPVGRGQALIRYDGVKNADGTPAYCLDTVDGARIQSSPLTLTACNPASSTQLWAANSSQITGQFTIASGACLSAPERGGDAVVGTCASLDTWTSSATDAEGAQNLVRTSADGTRLCLTVRAADSSGVQPVASEPCTGNAAQLWRVVPVLNPGGGTNKAALPPPPGSASGATVQIQPVAGISGAARGQLTTTCLTRPEGGSTVVAAACGSAALKWTVSQPS
jgi:hypothetical protein